MKKFLLMMLVTLTAVGTYCLATAVTYPPEKEAEYIRNLKVRDLQTMTGPVYNVKAYGATGDGTTDDTTAIQAAIDAAGAASPQGTVYLPVGTYKTTSTLNYKAPMKGEGYKSKIYCGITDGSACIEMDNDDAFELRDFVITSSNDSTKGNFIGIECVGDDVTSRGIIWNVWVRKSDAWGGKMNGIIYDFSYFYAYDCNNGFYFDTCNSARLHLNVESCDTTGIQINGGNDFVLTGVNESNGDGVILDDVKSSTIAMHFESNTGSNLLIGQTTVCTNLIIEGTIGDSDTASVIDQVDGIDFSNARIKNTEYITFTDNVTNIKGLVAASWNVTGPAIGSLVYGKGLQMQNDGMKAIYNYFANPYFTDSFRGYSAVTKVKCTTEISDDPNISRGGLRLTSTGAGAGSVYVDIVVDPCIAVALAGKSVTYGGWCYIPDDDTNFPDTGSTILPAMRLGYSSGGGYTQQTTNTQTWHNNGWSFFCQQYIVPDTTTGLEISLYLSHAPAVSVPADVNVVFGGIFITDCPTNVQDLAMGRWTIHPLAGRSIGSNLEWPGTAAPTDTDQDYIVGDKVVYTDPSVGTQEGWICTTAGSPGTWTMFGSIGYIGHFTGTCDPNSLAADANDIVTIAATGVAFGDFVHPSAPYDLQGMTVTAYVSAANVVKIKIHNTTTGTINLASGTWKVKVER